MIGCFANLGDYEDLLKNSGFLKGGFGRISVAINDLPVIRLFPGVTSAVLSIVLVYK